MPSSTHSVCYTGPSSVAQQFSDQPMHTRCYQPSIPAGTTLPSTVPGTSTRIRFLMDQHNHNPSLINAVNASRFNPPGTQSSQTNSYHCSGRSRNMNQQPNGVTTLKQPDLEPLPTHSPATAFRHWQTATNTTSPILSLGTAAPANPHSATYAPSGNTQTSSASHPPPNDKLSGPSKPNERSKLSSASSSGTSGRPLWKERPHVGRYSLIRTIGKGNFAKVKLAQHLTTGMQVAVKVIDKTLLNHSSMQKLFREVRVLKTLNHPNIIKLLEVIESERHLYLVMEYASGGEVFDYLVAHGKMKEADARVKFRQIVSAVQYCHQKMVVHRDLKAENLLLDADLNIKIADFGFSNYFSTTQKLDTFCGSPPYAAPELFLGRKYEGPEVDVWSLGVILYTLVSGTLPFDGKNLKELRERVLRGTYRIPFYMTHECEMLLKKMLILNPAKRLSLTEVMRDPWLNVGFDTVLRPYAEPPADYCDPERIETMIRMGFQPNEIQEALIQQRFNNITATYLLLAQYDPQVHGRLPSLRSTDEARGSKSDTRPRQAELVLNGGIQPVVTTVPLQHSSRPSNTLSASFQPQANVGTFAHYRRIPDGGVPTRSSISSARCRIDPPAQTTLKEAVALQQSTRSVSSVVKTSSSSGGTTSGVQPSRITVATAIPPSTRPCQLRRSATSIESKTSMPSSATITSAGAIATSAHTTTFGQCSSTTAPPSQAPPPDFSITSPSFNCQAPVITMRPSAITTAHLKLMNGPSIPACAIVPPVLAASPVPSSKPLNYEPSFAAPLAREDEEHRGASKNSPPVSCARRAPSRVDLSALTSNEATRSSSTSSSASDDLSNSDLYDREWGSESTDSGHSCASRSINRERRAKQSECGVASVAVTVVPSPDPLQLTSASNRRSSDKATPSKISTCEPNFARLPSVRRKSNTPVSAGTESANAYASPSNAVASRSTLAATSSPISRASTCEQRSVFNNTASIPNPGFTSALPCYRKETDFCASVETAKQNGGPDLAQKEYQQQLQTKPRLLHGQPSAADIISESNPFRLVADVSRSSVVSPPTVPPHTSRLPQVSDPSTSGSGLNPVNFLNGTIRRPNIPPPSLVSMVGAHPPNRVSYAYHSLRLPSSTASTTIPMVMGRQSDFGNCTNNRHDPCASLLWSSGNTVHNDGMNTPTPEYQPDTKDMFVVPFSRNLPERCTIQNVPTGRARERLEGPVVTPRLVRHPGTYSIARQSFRTRPRSPSSDPRGCAAPRPASPDDLSISSVTSTAILEQNGATSHVDAQRTHFHDCSPPAYSGMASPSAMRQSHTLGANDPPISRHSSVHPPNSGDGHNSIGGLNNFFRTLTTRISRSRLFRRSTVLQQSVNPNDSELTESSTPRNCLNSMLAPTSNLDKAALNRHGRSPEAPKQSNTRLLRSRSGIDSRRPVSQLTPRHQQSVDTGPNDRHLERGNKYRADSSECDEPIQRVLDKVERKPIVRRSSKRGSGSRSYSACRSTNSDVSDNLISPKPINSTDAECRRRTSISSISRSSGDSGRNVPTKSQRTMRYVLKPFARWPLDDVMVEVKRALISRGVDFEVIGEHRLQCVYGDPSRDCSLPGASEQTVRGVKKYSDDTEPSSGVVRWEMEIGKLAGVGANGIRFKRVNGSMSTFKRIAKKLAADLRF